MAPRKPEESSLLTHIKNGATLLEKQSKGNMLYKSIYHFVLECGRHYKIRESYPEELRKIPFMAGRCFANSQELIRSFPAIDLTYVEGYASVEEEGECIIISGLHAWLLDGDQKVIDPTFPDEGIEYYGVPFNWDYVEEVTSQQPGASVINQSPGFPLLAGTASGWRLAER